MSKCIAAWHGGINFIMQYAASDGGVLYKRFQERSRYGVKWGKWQYAGTVDIRQLPSTIPAGFGNARLAGKYDCVGWQRWRLPG
jgi:hypothetical protein